MKNQTLIIRSAAQAAALLRRLITIGFEKPIQVVFGNVTKKRTLSQNDTYWMWISEIARETGNNKDHVHEFYKDEFCPEKEITIGNCTKLVKSTKLLDKGEMYDYMSRVTAHAATELHVFVKYPDDFHRDQAA